MKLINKEKEQQQLILIICSTKTYWNDLNIF
jgi:hypothetical protein